MKIIKISLIFYFTIISFQSYSQTIQKSEFTIELLNEDFESENNYFPTTTDYDTYLLVDNGDYLVSRNINKSQFIKLNIGAVKDYSGMNPPFFFISSAIWLGLTVIAV